MDSAGIELEDAAPFLFQIVEVEVPGRGMHEPSSSSISSQIPFKLDHQLNRQQNLSLKVG